MIVSKVCYGTCANNAGKVTHTIESLSNVNNNDIVGPSKWNSFSDFVTNHFAYCSEPFSLSIIRENWLISRVSEKSTFS